MGIIAGLLILLIAVEHIYILMIEMFFNESEVAQKSFGLEKEFLKDELLKIDNVLNEKLDSLQKTEADTQAKAAEIEQKEKDLEWLNSIQTRVNNIIHF